MRKISLLFLSLLAFVNFVHAETTALDRPWILPLAFEKSSDPVVQQYNYYDFMWRSFIALNWPNVPIQVEHTPEGSVITSGYRGQPDKTRTPADLTAPRNKPLTVWETYKEPPNAQQAKYGFEGDIPPQVMVPHPKPVDIYWVTELPPLVKAANKHDQANLNNSVLSLL